MDIASFIIGLGIGALLGAFYCAELTQSGMEEEHDRNWRLYRALHNLVQACQSPDDQSLDVALGAAQDELYDQSQQKSEE